LMADVHRRQRAMHSIEHALICCGQVIDTRRDRPPRLLRFGAHKAGDDDLAIIGHGRAVAPGDSCLALSRKRRCDDDEISAVMLARQLVAFRRAGR